MGLQGLGNSPPQPLNSECGSLASSPADTVHTLVSEQYT